MAAASFAAWGETPAVTYNAGTDTISFTFDAADGAVNAITTSITEDADADIDGVVVSTVTETVAASAAVVSADTYVYTAASDSTASAMDQIENFDDSDLIDLSAFALVAGVTDLGDALDFDALGNGIGFFATDVAVGSDGDDARVFVDVDQDGDLTNADMQIQISGQANADFIDAAGDYIF